MNLYKNKERSYPDKNKNVNQIKPKVSSESSREYNELQREIDGEIERGKAGNFILYNFSFSVEESQSIEEQGNNDDLFTINNNVWTKPKEMHIEGNSFRMSSTHSNYNSTSYDNSNRGKKKGKYVPPKLDEIENEDIVNYCGTNSLQSSYNNSIQNSYNSSFYQTQLVENPFSLSIGTQNNNYAFLNQPSLSTKSKSFISFNNISSTFGSCIIQNLSKSDGLNSFIIPGQSYPYQTNPYKKNFNLTPVNKMSSHHSFFPSNLNVNRSTQQHQKNKNSPQIMNEVNQAQEFNPNKTIKIPKRVEMQIQPETNFTINIDDLIAQRVHNTTVMLKNIPSKYNVYELLKDINKTLGINDAMKYKSYDLVYLPISQEKADKNLKYAFFNFIAPIFIVDFYYKIKRINWSRLHNNNKKNKECTLAYAKVQGKENMINHLKEQGKSPYVFDTSTNIVDFVFYNNYKINIPKNYKSQAKRHWGKLYQNIDFIPDDE